MNQKRVYCLYRVSTVGQVEKDDIPMQRQYCWEFIERNLEWVLTNELYEKGISGFKVSAKERDAIQEMQRDAVQGKFEILLVYMFDRLGRKDDETPFVVEWFVQNGIEVWSAVEGQQRFDNHVDKLLNYIRYWQASGESVKTSVRTKTRLEQLTQEGCFTGGSVPYGYKLEKRGRINKKNREVCDVVIDEDAAQIIRLIFHKYVCDGYGSQRLCRYLSEIGIRKPDGKNIPTTSINRIIKNPMYMGVIHNGEARSEPIPELQIIDPKTFQRAQELMKGRATKHSDVPLNMSGHSLMVGNVYCGHCKHPLTLTTNGHKYVNRFGEVKREAKFRYTCTYNSRHPGECGGQSGYGMTKLDGIMDRIIRYQLGKVKAASADKIIAEGHEKAIELARARCNIASKQIDEKQRELADYEAETIKVIRGQSKLSIDLLNDLVAKAKEEIVSLTAALTDAQEELEKCLAGAEAQKQEYAQLETWADIYARCTFEARKMIVSQFVKSVYVYKDYTLEVEFNVAFEDFQNLVAECDGLRQTEPDIYVTPIAKENRPA